MTLGKLLHPLGLNILIWEVRAIIHTSRCPEECGVRSPQRGRHTGREGLGEQRGIEETRCIRAKVTLSCHACQGRGRRGGGGAPESSLPDSQTRLPPARLPAPLGLWSSFDSKKKRREGNGRRRKGQKHLPLEPFALKLAGEGLRQSLHTEYVEPLSGLKKIQYCLPNGSSVRNGCLFL